MITATKSSDHELPDSGAASVQPSRATYILRWTALFALAGGLVAIGMAVGIYVWTADVQSEDGGTIDAQASAPQAADQTLVKAATNRAEAAVADTAPSEPEAETDTDRSVVVVEEDPLPNRTSHLIAQTPQRVLDTRVDGEPPTETEPKSIDVQDDRTAVVVNVSVIGSSSPGTVQIDGGAGSVVAATIADAGVSTTNLVVVPVVGNRMTVRSSIGAHLVVDVVGSFRGSKETSAGRLITGPPTEIARLVTETDGRELAFSFDAAVPPDSASAVLVAITADVGADGGVVRIGQDAEVFDQMLMWGPTTPDDKVRRGLVLVPPSADGLSHLRYDGGSLLTAEVIGYFTSETQPASSEGLYVPSGPRLLFSDQLKPEGDITVDGIEQGADRALLTISSDESGTFSPRLVPVSDGSIMLSSSTALDIDVSLLGVFLGS